MQTTGQRLKEIMKMRRLRQVDIVEMARPYCEKYNRVLKKNALSQYVNDKAEPKRDMIALLAEALNVDDAWLLGYDVPMQRKTPTIDIGESEREILLRDLFKKLSPSGIRTHSGGEWQRQSFGTLLRNEQYIGVYSYNGIRIEDGIPAILDRETFEEVQTILTTKKNPRGRQRNAEDYLLTGKLFCGNCGKPMVGICGTSRTGERHYYYLCQGKHNKIGCDKKNERKEKIEQAVINAVKELILDDQTIDWIIDGYHQFMAQARGESAVTAMEKELADTEMGIDNLMRAIEMGIITDTTKARMMELEDKKKELEARIRIESRLLMELDPDQLRFSIERFRDKNINDKKYQKELINTFVKAVYVFDDHLKLVLNRGPGDEKDIPFDEISAPGAENEIDASCVRINEDKAYQTIPVRTHAITIRNYGIVVAVSY